MNKNNFFTTYFNTLLSEDVEYVILHSYMDYPQHFASDIDYCVKENELSKVLRVLSDFCKKNGWQIVQIMQHEINAFYCVCVSIESPMECLKLDVCGHYVREGKQLLEDSMLLGSSREHDAGFRIPAVGAEFSYVLWKTVAKAKDTEATIERLIELYDMDEEACEIFLQEASSTGDTAETRIVDACKKLRLKYLHLKHVSRFRECKRLVNRIVSPSGVMLEIVPNSKKDEPAVIEGLRHYLVDSFRACIFKRNSKLKLRDVKLMLRSTLVVYTPQVIGVLSRGIFSSRGGYLKIESDSDFVMTQKVNQFLFKRICKRWNL